MKKWSKITLIIAGLLIGIIILDTIQALVFNNNPIIGMEMFCKKKSGIFVDTYHCNNGNITKLKKSNVCNYNDICNDSLETDYLFKLEDVNNLITDYLQNKADISNVAYNYVDEENKKVVVGLVDANEEKQNKFIYDVFTHCCGSDYIRFLKEHKIIEFRESKDAFDGKVIDVKENRITVEVLEDCKSFKKLDKVIVRFTKIESNIYTVGNNIRVIFNGNVEYSNPPQIGAVRIEIIE